MPGINSTKKVQGLYTENYKHCLKKSIKIKIHYIFKNWEREGCYDSVFLKAIYRFNAIPIKIPVTPFVKLREPSLEFI